MKVARAQFKKISAMIGIVLKKLVTFRCVGRRKKNTVLVAVLLGVVLVTWLCCWWAAEQLATVLLPPRPPDQDLHHFRFSRSLQHYIDNIQVLIEPSSVCNASVIALVTSAPHRTLQRDAVRRSWAKYLQTYFILGLSNADDNLLADNYLEAKEYGDMVVFDFPDHYQNLTLKTALMMHWSLAHCPHAEFLLKTDDDVLVNPWTLNKIIRDHQDAKLIGYRLNNSYPHRDEYSKWYMPRWLHPEDLVPQYLSGTGYLVNGKYLKDLLAKGNEVPLVNLEDVYWTYLVGAQSLGYELRHERRLSPFRPWVPWDCVYWSLATTHSLSPTEILQRFHLIQNLAHNYNVSTVCSFFETYFFTEWLLRR